MMTLFFKLPLVGIFKMRKLIAFISITIISLSSLAQDRITFSNGDVLHGEIKGMEKNVLTLSTPYDDSDFKIDWEKIESIQSNREFHIFFSDKQDIYASLNTSGKKRHTVIAFGGVYLTEYSMNDIVIIDPIETKFSSRFDAYLGLGYSLTKANNNQQFTIDASASYEARHWILRGSFNSVGTRQEEVEDVLRTEGSLEYTYVFVSNWFGIVIADFFSNTEQSIRLRETYTPAFGNFVVRNRKLSISLSGGITYNREDFSDDTPNKASTEGFLGFRMDAYNLKDLKLLTEVSYFPSISTGNRQRLRLNVETKYDFPLDFFIKLGYTLNYDSQPPNNGPQDDFVFKTTLGWEF